MVQQNEFRGATLWEAVRKATAIYDRKNDREDRRRERRCNDLLLQISSLQRDLARIGDKADRLSDEADRLRRSARIDFSLAVLSALGGLAGSLRALAIVARRLKNKDPKRLKANDVLELLSFFGPVGSAFSALRAVAKLREAERLAQEAEEVERNGVRTGEELLAVLREYDRTGCGENSRFIGS